MKCFIEFSKEKLITKQPHLTLKTMVSTKKKKKIKNRGVNINEVIELTLNHLCLSKLSQSSSQCLKPAMHRLFCTYCSLKLEPF